MSEVRFGFLGKSLNLPINVYNFVMLILKLSMARFLYVLLITSIIISLNDYILNARQV